MLTLRSVLFAGAVLIAPLSFNVLLLPTVAVGQSRLPPCPNDLPELSWDNCQGSNTSSIGNKYVGEFKDGRPNGQGTLTLANGDKYVGEFKNGKGNGQGTFTAANGDKYIGEFKDGASRVAHTYLRWRPQSEFRFERCGPRTIRAFRVSAERQQAAPSFPDRPRRNLSTSLSVAF
jgi:hypothetical protein